jgi:hypothetical protein
VSEKQLFHNRQHQPGYRAKDHAKDRAKESSQRSRQRSHQIEPKSRAKDRAKFVRILQIEQLAWRINEAAKT